MRLKIAARRSDLARLQAHMVAAALHSVQSDLEVEFSFKASVGDLNPDRSLMDFTKGAFTSDFVQDLLSGECDMVVHSWKDLPVEETPGTAVVATLERADVRDLLLIPKKIVESKPKSLRILASSPRRAYNLQDFLPDILPWKTKTDFTPVRGNVPTRLQKMLSGEGEGLIVAKAAIDRLLSATQNEFSKIKNEIRDCINHCHWMVLPLSRNPAAAAQGALAIEIKSDREDLRRLLAKLNDSVAEAEVREERRILSQYGGGCHQKIGVSILTRADQRVLSLRGLTDDGKVLRHYGWEKSSGSPKSKSAEEIFPNVKSEAKWFRREPLPSSNWADRLGAANAIFAARGFAWPEGLSQKSQVVWTAGVKSWQELAEKGVWVNGCADYMGEVEDQRVEVLAGKRLSWVRLTHEEAAASPQSVATYRLVPLETGPNLENKTHFYWSSGSAFLRAKELWPKAIAKGFHACGPGKTRALIRKEIGREPAVFLTWSEWRRSILSPGDGDEN